MIGSVDEYALVRAISREFDRRKWDDDDNLAPLMTKAIFAQSSVEGGLVAADADPGFFTRNDISRSQLGEAVRAAIAGRALESASSQSETSMTTNHFEISGGHVVISGIVNVGDEQSASGSTQIITVNSSPADLLSSVSALVRDALSSGFSVDKLEALDRVVGSRADLTSADIEEAAERGAREAGQDKKSVAEVRDQIAASAISSLLVQGILAGLALI